MQPFDASRTRLMPGASAVAAKAKSGTMAPGRPNMAQVAQLHTRYRILVVDDMSVSRGVMAQCLEGLGCKHVFVAGDARTALNALRTAPVDLILSDYLMPGMTGLDLLKRLRQTPELALTRFVLVTGAPEPGLERQAAALGVSAILWKPYNLRDLRATIERVMGRALPSMQGRVRHAG